MRQDNGCTNVKLLRRMETDRQKRGFRVYGQSVPNSTLGMREVGSWKSNYSKFTRLSKFCYKIELILKRGD